MELGTTISIVAGIFVLIAMGYSIFAAKLNAYRMSVVKEEHAEQLANVVTEMNNKYDEVVESFHFRLDYLSRHMEAEIAGTHGVSRGVKSHLISSIRRLTKEEISRGGEVG